MFGRVSRSDDDVEIAIAANTALATITYNLSGQCPANYELRATPDFGGVVSLKDFKG